jgi:uncharacterized membrane protein YhiD involved in acid resistance
VAANVATIGSMRSARKWHLGMMTILMRFAGTTVFILICRESVGDLLHRNHKRNSAVAPVDASVELTFTLDET